jgi:hypothetical protein
MSFSHPRMRRERRTIVAMIDLYCRDHHGGGGLCPSCARLQTYALRRLAACPYQEAKPTCARCPIHCYRTAERAEIRDVMRYAGPRMLWHHPYLAIRHLLDRFEKPPAKTTRQTRRQNGIEQESDR